MDDLVWWVLLPDNTRKKFNIFDSYGFRQYLMNLKAVQKKQQDIDLKDSVKGGLMYQFWGRCEYELVIRPFVGHTNSEYKIDVWEQVEMNFEHFYEYLMSHWNKVPAKTYRQQRRMK